MGRTSAQSQRCPGQAAPGAGPSIVNDDFGDVYGVYVAITGEGYTYKEIYEYAKFLQRELLHAKDVKRIELYGVQPEVIYVEMRREKMAELGISQQRPLPVVNKTEGRRPEWQSYYTSDSIKTAKRLFCPFMNEWGYEFPESWGPAVFSPGRMLMYRFQNLLRKIYFTHFRYSESFFANQIRSLRAYLVKARF